MSDLTRARFALDIGRMFPTDLSSTGVQSLAKYCEAIRDEAAPKVPNLSVDCISQGCRRQEFTDRCVQADDELERQVAEQAAAIARLREALEHSTRGCHDAMHRDYRTFETCDMPLCSNVRALLTEGQA